MGKSSLQRELDRFLKQISACEFSIRSVTKSAFTQSRRDLNPDAFLELNDIVCSRFYEQVRYLGYQQHRVLAIDGTSLVLPNSSDIARDFGTIGYGPYADVEKSLARVSFLYDVGNFLVLDAQIGSTTDSEQSLARQNLKKARAGDLVLMDRGYPSRAMFAALASKGVHFCVRMKESWVAVEKFAQSGQTETEVTFDVPVKDREALLTDYPDLNQTVRCRLVKVALPDGNTEILCTSLLDKRQYPAADFAKLYHLRWSEEEAYKMLKARVGIESFSGKTTVSVLQDIFSKVLMMSLCAAFAFPIEEKVKAEYKQENGYKHPQKINRTGALANLKDIAVGLLIQQKYRKAIQAFDDIVYKTREVVRPGRSSIRNHKPKKKYYLNYKDL